MIPSQTPLVLNSDPEHEIFGRLRKVKPQRDARSDVQSPRPLTPGSPTKMQALEALMWPDREAPPSSPTTASTAHDAPKQTSLEELLLNLRQKLDKLELSQNSDSWRTNGERGELGTVVKSLEQFCKPGLTPAEIHHYMEDNFQILRSVA